MRTKVLLGAAVALMLVVSVATIGSNMGFKISIPLAAGGYLNWIALPYYDSYSNAAAIFSDIPSCTQVSRWDNPSGSYQTWNGVKGTNFTPVAGEAYLVKVSVAGNWVVVGSHNPGFALSLSGNGALNWISVPYHTVDTNAAALFSEISSCTQVSRWDNTSGSYQTWNGVKGTNFTLTPGEGVLVKVSATTVPWTPAHY